ncbi:MAG: hypothetical protein JWN01_496 [Patescibacteria group bacterium]|nr:hypothetical protein [Patescibacteria group bacterium]
MGCPDDRLLDAQTGYVQRQGGGFLVRMVGGGLAILTERDGKSARGQITDCYRVSPFPRVVLRIHLDCGKLALMCGEGGEFHGLFDSTSQEELYEVGGSARDLVMEDFQREFGIHMPVSVEVHRIIFGEDNRPTTELVPRLRLVAASAV